MDSRVSPCRTVAFAESPSSSHSSVSPASFRTSILSLTCGFLQLTSEISPSSSMKVPVSKGTIEWWAADQSVREKNTPANAERALTKRLRDRISGGYGSSDLRDMAKIRATTAAEHIYPWHSGRQRLVLLRQLDGVAVVECLGLVELRVALA